MNLTRRMIWDMVLATALIAGTAFLTYYFTSGLNDVIVPNPQPHLEKVSITGVKFDADSPNMLLVDTKWVSTGPENQTITFTRAIVKNGNGEIVLAVDLDNVNLLPHSEMTVKVAMENKLPSGKYVIELATTNGSYFVSSQFTQP